MEFNSLTLNGGTPPAPVPVSPPPPPVERAQQAQSSPPPAERPEIVVEPIRIEPGRDQSVMDDIDRTISSANTKIAPLFLEFQYRIHERTNALMISVINTNTREVIREIPPERNLDALAKMWELVGILCDERR
jgi:flagellar protein FlaG